MDIVLSKHLLETPLREELVVDVATADRVVSDTLVTALANGSRGEALQGGTLVLALLLPPLAHVLEHLLLDLGLALVPAEAQELTHIRSRSRGGRGTGECPRLAGGGQCRYPTRPERCARQQT